MSSEFNTLSDILELPVGIFGYYDEESLPESLRTTAIEAISLPSIDSIHPGNELYQLENESSVRRELLDISQSIRTELIHLQIVNTPYFINQNNHVIINDQNIENHKQEQHKVDEGIRIEAIQNTNELQTQCGSQISAEESKVSPAITSSTGVILDSNANIIKLMKAEEELEELEAINKRLEESYQQSRNEIKELKRAVIEQVRLNNIQFDATTIKKTFKRKNSVASSSLSCTSSQVFSTSSCSSDNPRRSRGRPPKNIDEAKKKLEEAKPKLNAKQLKVAKNNVSCIISRKNKNKRLENLYDEEQRLTELNNDLNEKYQRNNEIIEAALKSVKL
ncbi:putative leucine-rich repeat-containing protein DDB_G0290503 [Chironomus tepperi]|uniref:putative leucine-rich repeat-containing protein DDB_G0290503 n=1 Tax=Chironomus tepperi TaxID=113505 RepID=UPI00391F3411